MPTLIEIENEQLKKDLELEKSKSFNQQKDIALIMALAGKSFANNGLPVQVNILTALQITKQDMAKQELHLVFDESGNPVIKQTKGGVYLDYFLDNKKVDLDYYVDSTLRAKNFIETTGTNKDVDNVVLQLVNQRLPNTQPEDIIGNKPASSVFANASIVQESRARLQQLGIQSSNQ